MICELRTSYPIYGQRLDNHSNMESVPGLRADLESHPTVTHWQLADARWKRRRRPTLVRAFLRQGCRRPHGLCTCFFARGNIHHPITCSEASRDPELVCRITESVVFTACCSFFNSRFLFKMPPPPNMGGAVGPSNFDKSTSATDQTVPRDVHGRRQAIGGDLDS